MGYHNVPPPFNDNYLPNLKTEQEKEHEKAIRFGTPKPINLNKPEFFPSSNAAETNSKTQATIPPINSIFVKSVAESSVNENKSNISTSCADEDLVKGDAEVVASVSNSVFVNQDLKSDFVCVDDISCSGSDVLSNLNCLNSVSNSVDAKTENILNVGVSKTKTVNVISNNKYRPHKPVLNETKCKCDCELKRQQGTRKGDGPLETSGSGNSHNPPTQRKQTCFNCGIPGHIARNFPRRPYVPYYGQTGRHEFRGRTQRRVSPENRASDGNWRKDKAHKQAARVRSDRFRPKSVKPNSAKSVPKPVPKPCVNPSICVSNKVLKPNYRWLPKGSRSQNSSSTTSSVCSIFDTQDMTWQSVSSLNNCGKPSYVMDWVPKSY